MGCVKSILESEVFWNFVSVLSSFIIVQITLREEKKSGKENREAEDKQQKIELELQERLHIESVKVEKEQVRAGLLPFLKLEQEIHIGKREGNYFFPLKITNFGNSGAFDICVESKSLENTGLCYVCEYTIYDEIDYYQYTGFLFDNVLPVGHSGTFEILLDRFREGEHYTKSDRVVVGEIRFAILFKDSLYNQYRQEYMIQFSSSMGCGRVESYLPELLAES